MTLEELYQGEPFQIKKKSYLSTRDYVEPFIDNLTKFTDNFIIQAVEAKQQSVEDKLHKMYNRVYVQAVLPESYWSFENHVEVIGMVYGLDVRKPIYKLFRGGINQACTNLCVFSPYYLITQDIKPDCRLDISAIKNLMELTSDMESKLKSMKNTFIDRDNENIQRELGRWVDFSIKHDYDNGLSKAKLSTSLCIDAYKSLFIDEDSKYYIPESECPSIFNIYNAFTEIISHDNRDIMNMVEKTLLLSNMLLK